MSQAGPPERSRKRKLKHSKPLLEQIPSLPPSADKQKQQHKRQQQQQQQQPEQQQQDALSAGNSKFARALGSTDFHTREQGLQALSRWLTHKQSVSELDMLKLWKGIYFCFWHSDKEPVQEDLAERLAGLIPRMQPGMAVLYWSGMLATLRSEWFALDRHRLNKFLMLVRKFVAALFKRLAAEDWSVDTIQTFTSNLPLVGDIIPTNSSNNSSSLGTEARQTTRSLGLSYHLADVWLPELRKVAGEGPLPPEGLAALLEPFVGVLQHSGEAALINRIREAVFEALVQDVAAAAAAAASVEDSSSDSDDEDMDVSDLSAWAYCAALDPAGYAALLFDRGAQQGVRARNREALYGLSKDLERGAGKKRKAGAAGAAAPAAAAAAGGRQQVQHKQSKKEQQQQQGEQEHSAHKKHKQQAVEPQQQQQQQQEAANGHVAKPSGAKKQKRQQQEAAAAASASAAKRGVKIDLKKNLYFEHGAPPPAADIRTPPKAQPKGSALKTAAVKLDDRGRPASDGKQQQQQSARRKLVTPSSVPRLRAAEFF